MRPFKPHARAWAPGGSAQPEATQLGADPQLPSLGSFLLPPAPAQQLCGLTKGPGGRSPHPTPRSRPTGKRRYRAGMLHVGQGRPGMQVSPEPKPQRNPLLPVQHLTISCPGQGKHPKAKRPAKPQARDSCEGRGSVSRPGQRLAQEPGVCGGLPTFHPTQSPQLRE